MVRVIWRLGAAVALAGALLGCAPRPMVQQKAPPPDPLLITKKPIEGNPRAEDVHVTARLQPPAPPAPAADFASNTPREKSSPVRPADLRPRPPVGP